VAENNSLGEINSTYNKITSVFATLRSDKTPRQMDIGYLYALAYLNFKYINPLKTQKSQYYF